MEPGHQILLPLKIFWGLVWTTNRSGNWSMIASETTDQLELTVVTQMIPEDLVLKAGAQSLKCRFWIISSLLCHNQLLWVPVGREFKGFDHLTARSKAWCNTKFSQKYLKILWNAVGEFLCCSWEQDAMSCSLYIHVTTCALLMRQGL